MITKEELRVFGIFLILFVLAFSGFFVLINLPALALAGVFYSINYLGLQWLLLPVACAYGVVWVGSAVGSVAWGSERCRVVMLGMTAFVIFWYLYLMIIFYLGFLNSAIT